MPTKQEIITAYQAHETAGREYYESFRADRALLIISGDTTVEAETAMALHLNSVKQELLTGDWRTARAVLGTLPANVDCPKAVLDTLKSDFDTYIAANFS